MDEYRKYVVAVLLADGWHEVHERSFRVSYDDSMWRNLNGYDEPYQTEAKEDLCFSFYVDENESICGPLSSVIAVRCDEGDWEPSEPDPLVLKMSVERWEHPAFMPELRSVLLAHPGPSPVHVQLYGRDDVIRLDDRYRVATTPALIGDLRNMYGVD